MNDEQLDAIFDEAGSIGSFANNDVWDEANAKRGLFRAGIDEGLRQAAEIVKSYLEDGDTVYYGNLQTVWEGIESEVTA